MAYVYRHIRKDKNIPFYIGIGKDDNGIYFRAHSLKSRNNHWNNIVKITDYNIDILFDNLTWKEACEKEIEFIKLYGKIINKGFLCNIADGGQGGCLGEEVNNKRKISLLNHPVSEETKNKIRIKSIGRKASEETKLKMSNTHKNNNTGCWLQSKGHFNGRAYKIYQYDLLGEFIKEWDCAKYAIDFYKMNKTAITDCLSGKQKTAKGFIWKKELIN